MKTFLTTCSNASQKSGIVVVRFLLKGKAKAAFFYALHLIVWRISKLCICYEIPEI